MERKSPYRYKFTVRTTDELEPDGIYIRADVYKDGCRSYYDFATLRISTMEAEDLMEQIKQTSAWRHHCEQKEQSSGNN